MNHSKLFATVTLFTTATLPISHTALAQSPVAPFGGRGPITDQEVYHPPEAYVLKAEATVQPDRTVQGTVTFWNNTEEILGDMTYLIELIGELPAATTENPVVEDTASVYDTVPSAERFVLLGGEKKVVPFTYTPPKNLPGGNYRVEITVSTGRGRTMGWYDIPVSIPGEKTPFAEIVPGKIQIAEYGDERFDPQTGPNVGPEKSLTVTALATIATPQSLIPIVDVYRFSPSRPLVKSIRGTAVFVQPSGTELALQIPTSKEPGVYVGMLTLKNPTTNEVMSTSVKYRWVVRGPDADILYARMQSYASTKGENATFSIDYVGAGDAQTKTTGNMTIDLQDDAGSVGTLSVPNIELNDSIRSGKATITLDRNLSGNPTLNISINNTNNKQLATYNVPFTFTPEQLKTLERSKMFSRILLYAGIGLVLGGAAILARLQLQKRRRK